ncbi:MAG: membrane integrity-associated transporter subunit PqiC [Candidatus Delongbacteria bacterium]|nr:membrane integrity-associated transporter subunit PqiC [Candidatus Delongbacteria bacterium]
MNNRTKLSLIAAFFILISCSVKTLKEHYVLSYLPDPAQNEKYKSAKIPFDFRVEVQNFEMNRIYDRNSIVIRESLHKLSYDKTNEWALRPDKGIPELLVYHINSLNLFKECKIDFLSDNPDFYISGMISNLEIYKSEIATFAHVKIFFEFRDSSRNILIRHIIDKKAELVKPDISFFIKTVSDVLKAETDMFLLKIVDYLKTHAGDD